MGHVPLQCPIADDANVRFAAGHVPGKIFRVPARRFYHTGKVKKSLICMAPYYELRL